MAEGVPCSA